LVAEPLTAYSNITAKEAESIPIEALFIERFIQLCKDGGWISIIIPDGILSNSNMHYLREFIAENTKVEAIVSLPRDAFKHVGTSAKTSILFLKKQRMIDHNYPVFLAELNKMEGDGLKQISEQYKEFYYD
jgi:type I restriction enzyme M protein